ncbi:hypothetical protein CEXT_280441 [Caerostris extrusa]|uniref:Uncharacterized protein n=1 Tax=Caerostris extrusa TaxID=172846 RepID=A0AAV4NX71_CAEEX|nr:hypothetical protein CEXT_280441 [Caerostris extrusa]
MHRAHERAHEINNTPSLPPRMGARGRSHARVASGGQRTLREKRGAPEGGAGYSGRAARFLVENKSARSRRPVSRPVGRRPPAERGRLAFSSSLAHISHSCRNK